MASVSCSLTDSCRMRGIGRDADGGNLSTGSETPLVRILMPTFPSCSLHRQQRHLAAAPNCLLPAMLGWNSFLMPVGRVTLKAACAFFACHRVWDEARSLSCRTFLDTSPAADAFSRLFKEGTLTKTSLSCRLSCIGWFLCTKEGREVAANT